MRQISFLSKGHLVKQDLYFSNDRDPLDHEPGSAQAELGLQSFEADPSKRDLYSPDNSSFAPHKLRRNSLGLTMPSRVNPCCVARATRDSKPVSGTRLEITELLAPAPETLAV